MKKLTMVGVAVSLVLLVSTDIRAQNLIQNGSFESPGVGFQQRVTAGSIFLTDWVVGGTGDIFIHNGPANGGDYGPAQDGLDYLDLSGDGPPHANVYQDFSTIPGIQYSLTLYIGSSSYTPSPTINVQLQGANVLLDTTFTPLAPSGSINWLEEEFSFTPDSAITRLSFVDTSGSDDNASYVDNVSVSEIPEPTTLLPIGLIALALWKRR
jgi:hypothetical protein